MNADRTAANHAKSVATPQVTAMWTSGQRPAFAESDLAFWRILSRKRNANSREIRGTRLGSPRSQMAKSSRLRRGRKGDASGKAGCCLLFRGWPWLGCTFATSKAAARVPHSKDYLRAKRSKSAIWRSISSRAESEAERMPWMRSLNSSGLEERDKASSSVMSCLL